MDPAVELDFDFDSGPEALPLLVGLSVARKVVPTANGTYHSVLFWWELVLQDGGRDGNCT